VQVWLNAKARALGRAFSQFFMTSFFFLYFYFNGLSETKMPTLADLFLVCKRPRLLGFAILILELGRFRGLTCDFWAENDKKNKGKSKDNKSVALPFGLRSGPSTSLKGRAASRIAAG
jgi:hypothetical protein